MHKALSLVSLVYLTALFLMTSYSVSQVEYVFASSSDSPAIIDESDDCHAALQFFIGFKEAQVVDGEPIDKELKSGYTVTMGPGNWTTYDKPVNANYLNYNIAIHPGTKIRRSHLRASDWSTLTEGSGTYSLSYKIEVLGYLKMTKLK